MLQQWSRAEALELVRERLWLWLSSSAEIEHLPALAEELFQLPRGQLRRLAAAHLALLPETTLALEAAERVLHELPSSVVRSELELVSSVRGPVNWQRTQQRQLSTNDPTRFVCRPAERRYDTPLARLVKLVLREVSGLRPIAGLRDQGAAGERIDAICRRADRLLAHAKLTEVVAVDHLPERTLEGVRRYRHTAPLIEFARVAREAIDLLNSKVLESVVTSQLLAPSSDDRLFELMTGFAMVDELVRAGFQQEFALITEEGVPFARLTGPVSVAIWWQRSLWKVLGGRQQSRYRQALVASSMTLSSLRPDFLVVCESPPRILLVEVKQTVKLGAAPERRGLVEALAYLQDAELPLSTCPEPHALVVGWNAKAVPGIDRVVVASQSQLGDAIRLILDAWTAE